MSVLLPALEFRDAERAGVSDPAGAGADTLRFLTCGSVDDGKSTLVGRLLYDAGLIMADQLAVLEVDSRRHGTVAADLDFALLVDGLDAEREQGITIDVAYRFFATNRRRFIMADTPGHEQYTRNMATGASTADLAVLLVDVQKGLTRQTRRHAVIASLLGVPRIVLAVNKMDLVGFDQAAFLSAKAAFEEFAKSLSFRGIDVIPVCARDGDNVARASDRMPWYQGPDLISLLETCEVARSTGADSFRLAIQWVCRPSAAFRGFAGFIASGAVRVNDLVTASHSGRTSRIARILRGREECQAAYQGDSVLVTLEDDLDLSRGDVLAAETRPQTRADQFAAHLIWMDADPLLPGRSYLMMLGTQTVSVQITALKCRLDIDTLQPMAERTLAMNEIGIVNVAATTAVTFDPYRDNRLTGSFVLIDCFSNATVAAGLVDHPLNRATNLHRQDFDIDRAARASLKHQRPTIVWLTGLSGAGKSTIANLVEKRLWALGRHTMILDGDNVRLGLNRDLGFTDADRVENIRRVAETAKLMAEAGLLVLVSFISPFRAERAMARELVAHGEFVEIFVDASIEVCIARDPKGLYAQARAGALRNFTGVDSGYEPPEAPELRLRTDKASAEHLADQVIDYLVKQGRLTLS